MSPLLREDRRNDIDDYIDYLSQDGPDFDPIAELDRLNNEFKQNQQKRSVTKKESGVVESGNESIDKRSDKSNRKKPGDIVKPIKDEVCVNRTIKVAFLIPDEVCHSLRLHAAVAGTTLSSYLDSAVTSLLISDIKRLLKGGNGKSSLELIELGATQNRNVLVQFYTTKEKIYAIRLVAACMNMTPSKLLYCYMLLHLKKTSKTPSLESLKDMSFLLNSSPFQFGLFIVLN